MDNNKKYKAVPKTRVSRFSRVARIAGGVAAGMLGEGAKQLSQGKRPKITDMLLTPANATRVTKQLSAMRGAAMKIGQLLSMEGGDFLPEELSSILAQLRDQAMSMPRAQLEASLTEAYGEDWLDQFESFDYAPLAAASIGQVHRATTLAGEELVLKIQYPGIAQSIDSDVDNIATLLKISNLLPKHMDITNVLEDAKRQLHDEANYFQEAKYLEQFYELLADLPAFVVPKHYPELTKKTILAMQYVAGESIEKIDLFDGAERDELMTHMFELMLLELFDLRLMQTDANFANYHYQASTQKIVLLDFGASRTFPKKFVSDYKRLIRAVISQDDIALIDAADRLGYHARSASKDYQQFLLGIFYIGLEPFAHRGDYDFADANLSSRLTAISEQAHDFKEFWQTPPTNILYLHRKLAGMFLLATRLGARVNCNALVLPWIKTLA